MTTQDAHDWLRQVDARHEVEQAAQHDVDGREDQEAGRDVDLAPVACLALLVSLDPLRRLVHRGIVRPMRPQRALQQPIRPIQQVIHCIHALDVSQQCMACTAQTGGLGATVYRRRGG